MLFPQSYSHFTFINVIMFYCAIQSSCTGSSKIIVKWRKISTLSESGQEMEVSVHLHESSYEQTTDTNEYAATRATNCFYTWRREQLRLLLGNELQPATILNIIIVVITAMD
jgi:hypothetical protein